MKKLQLTACMLAFLAGGLPLAACGTSAETEEGAQVSPAPDFTEEPAPPAEENPAPADPPSAETPEEPNEPNEPTGTVPQPEPPQAPEAPVKAEYIRIKSDGLNVRAGAGTEYTTLGKLEKDVLLKLAGEKNGWYETRYKNRTAYVSANAKYTSVTLLEQGETDVENVIEQGLRLLGVPYVYGAVRLHDGKGNFLKGFTVKQFDCSSLMQYMFYYGAHINLNTTTRTQVSQGKAVAKANIRRGDLLFFTNASRKNNTGIERVGHVALYLGDNYILHTASDYAKIEQISSTRWSYYITARRMF